MHALIATLYISVSAGPCGDTVLSVQEQSFRQSVPAFGIYVWRPMQAKQCNGVTAEFRNLADAFVAILPADMYADVIGDHVFIHFGYRTEPVVNVPRAAWSCSPRCNSFTVRQ